MFTNQALLANTISLAWVDWLIVGLYLLAVVAIGTLVGRKNKAADDMFLGGRSMPMWAVAVSILATSQSAATFVGGPQQAYAGNLTYFAANLGALVAVVIVAVFFLPAYYKANVTSVYELIGQTWDSRSQRLASAMFLIGRVFASGARLFIVAIPFSLIAFGGDLNEASLVVSIVIIGLVATCYTLVGGIRAVIWTDVLQAVIYISTIVAALILLWTKIPLSSAEIVEMLRAADEGSKLQIVDLGFDKTFFSTTYSLPAILIGLMLLNLAAFGADQDLTQRMLTCKSSKHAAWSIILSNFIAWPVVGIFLIMGLLLWVFYHPDIVAADVAVANDDDSRKIFIHFILHEMPMGLRGLMLAGLFAASMSSMDSALNAMASSSVADFVRPALAKRSGVANQQSELRWSRGFVIFWAIALISFASICVFWQQASGDTLIDFALTVMVFAYSGLLAVFLCAIFTRRRGSPISVAAALATGFVTILLFRFVELPIAFPWQMAIATTLSFSVCCLGRRHVATEPIENKT